MSFARIISDTAYWRGHCSSFGMLRLYTLTKLMFAENGVTMLSPLKFPFVNRLCQMLMLPRVFFANTHMHHNFSSLSLFFLLLVVEDLVVQASGEEVGVGSVQNQALVIKEEVDSVPGEDSDKNRAEELHLSGEVVV